MTDPGWPDGGLCLPPPMAIKKRKIERAAVECLAGAGFSPIELPMLEYLPAEDGDGSADRCKFVAPDGRLLGLRYDHTTSLIRFVATQNQVSLPARLFYSGAVYRRKKNSGAVVEAAQVGAEILGIEGSGADTEIIRVLAKTLAAAGVTDFVIDIGTVEVFKGIVSGTSVDAGVLSAIRDAIHRKDASALKQTLAGSGLPVPKMKALESMTGWFGGKDVFDRAAESVESDRSRRGLEHLHRVYETLTGAGSTDVLKDRITLDLGVVQSLDYYTGTVFEAYSRRVGQPIASGGRYDRLADACGKSIPATGFALNLGLLLDIVP